MKDLTCVSPGIKDKIRSTMDELEANVAGPRGQCIRFEPRTNQASYLSVVKETGCHSIIGFYDEWVTGIGIKVAQIGQVPHFVPKTDIPGFPQTISILYIWYLVLYIYKNRKGDETGKGDDIDRMSECYQRFKWKDKQHLIDYGCQNSSLNINVQMALYI